MSEYDESGSRWNPTQEEWDELVDDAFGSLDIRACVRCGQRFHASIFVAGLCGDCLTRPAPPVR